MEHEANIGRIERRIRIWIGFLFIGIAGLTALSEWGTLAAFFLGVFAMYTGIHQYCPLWKLFGISTCDHNPQHH